MKKNHNSRSAFFNPRFLLSFAFCSIGLFLALIAAGAFSNSFAQPKTVAAAAPSSVDAIEQTEPFSMADASGRSVHLIEFAEPGVIQRHQPGPGEQFTMNTGPRQADLAQIRQEQTVHIQQMASAVGRQLDVTHHYLVTHSGIATRLTPQEADIVRALPGVAKVERERVYELDTYRTPFFIGADKIWDGTAVPSAIGSRGQGIVIASLDTGLDPTHPSYANQAACGHGTTAPNKLLSALDCASTDGAGLCNGPSPADTDGHGSHTSSTAGGNTLDATAVPPPAPPPPATTISGIAPCASIRAYKVCPASCPGADIQAGMNSILLHGDVKVMSFSISGGTSPWTDNDRRKLDLVNAGIVVSASAGNTSATITNPVGQVNHRGPWVMTVAASTKDGAIEGQLSASGPGSPPPGIQNISMDKGSASPDGTPFVNKPIRHFTGQDPNTEGCTPGEDTVDPGLTPFPPGFFTGAVALIRRGVCPFTKKIQNAFNAGADFVVIRNNVATPVSMDTTGQPNIPAYSINQDVGDALAAFVDANPTTATVNFALAPTGGDVLAGFSFRGPITNILRDLTKPDVTGPGVDIYAAVPVAQGGYGLISGTSMSSPHLAGGAALLRAVQPTWTAPEVKSALMMSAFNTGFKENGTTAWDIDDVGHGRIDMTKAARAGFVMHETFANFLAANPSAPTNGDPKTLNLPSLRNNNCFVNCVWTRTVRNTRGTATTWTATGTAITPGFTINVVPPTFAFTGSTSETQLLTITATPTTDLTAAMAFGEVTFTSTGNVAPAQRFTVAIKGAPTAPTPTPTPTATPSATATATPGPSASPTATGTPGPSASPSATATATPNPGAASQATNLSTRMNVLTGNNVGIGGFIVTGSTPKHVLIRGIGPSLARFFVPNPLANPVLQLHGPSGFATVTNNNWRDTQEAAIQATGLAPTDDLESAIDATLQPGAYTAILSGANNGTGVGLFEVYDITQGISAKLANVSTRAFIGTGGDVVIAGFILGNSAGNGQVIIRGLGPSLSAFVSPVLADPTLELRDRNGNLVISDNDWQDNPSQAAQITAAGLAPSNAKEAAIAANLPADLYTAILSGLNNTTGIGIVEMYDRNAAPGPTPGPTPTPGPSASPTATGTPGPTGTPAPTSTPAPTGTPAPTSTPAPTATPTPAPPCVQNFDGVTAPALPAGWTAVNAATGIPNGVMWVTSTVTPDTAPNDAFVDDQNGVSDKYLISRDIVVGTGATLSFRNNFNTEADADAFWDGGVLEVSSPNINGGAFTDVTNAAVGGSFTSGGYTGEIDGTASNPLAGRQAWSGNSGGYINTVVNLGPNVNGQTIKLRWRMGTDLFTTAPGWRIDTLVFTNASCQ